MLKVFKLKIISRHTDTGLKKPQKKEKVVCWFWSCQPPTHTSSISFPHHPRNPARTVSEDTLLNLAILLTYVFASTRTFSGTFLQTLQ